MLYIASSGIVSFVKRYLSVKKTLIRVGVPGDGRDGSELAGAGAAAGACRNHFRPKPAGRDVFGADAGREPWRVDDPGAGSAARTVAQRADRADPQPRLQGGRADAEGAAQRVRSPRGAGTPCRRDRRA